MGEASRMEHFFLFKQVKICTFNTSRGLSSIYSFSMFPIVATTSVCSNHNVSLLSCSRKELVLSV